MPQGTSPSDPKNNSPNQRIGTAKTFLEQALGAFQSGNHGLAERILGQIVVQQPQAAAVWHLRGLNAAAANNLPLASLCLINAVGCDTGNAQYCASLASHLTTVNLDHAAIEPWQRAVDLAPENPIYRAELAYCLARLGHHGDALPLLDAATKDLPGDANLMAAYGMALLHTGDRERAIRQLRRAATIAPKDASITSRLGYALQEAGRESEAIQAYQDALALDPDMDETRLNMAACMRSLGRNDAAMDQCREVLARRPHSVHALNNLAAALCDAGRYDEAVAALERVLRHEPENTTALHNLGIILDARNAPAEAEACFRKCLEVRPDLYAVKRSLANLLRSHGRFAEAAVLYQAVVDRQPLDFASYGNLGLILLNLNKPADAISVYEKAVALQPGRPEMKLGLGIAQLATGDMVNGWANYEARLEMERTRPWRPGLGIPQWRGESWSDRDAAPTILVHAEQGFGDTIHFCRYVPLLAAAGARIVFECQPSLVSLMASLAGSFSLPAFPIITPDDPAPRADFHLPLLSLPQYFTSDPEAIPAIVPYVAPPPDKRQKWAMRHFSGTPAVGLAWAGNPARQDDRLRSCPADALAPIIALDGIDFYSLQKGASGHGIMGLTDLMPSLEDFGDTAAAIERLDLVISVDTAVAHLAGALGKPVWVMLGHTADWRYLLDRDDSPWYPTMRLFRQAEDDDWHRVAERIAEALREFGKSRK